MRSFSCVGEQFGQFNQSSPANINSGVTLQVAPQSAQVIWCSSLPKLRFESEAASLRDSDVRGFFEVMTYSRLSYVVPGDVIYALNNRNDLFGAILLAVFV